MADNTKYYYMRLKENFFETDELQILESMPDGYLYSNILLKLYLKSLKNNGKLMFNNRIPYSVEMIATITKHQIGTVERALKIFQEMELIEVLDNGAIYMLDIQNYIGKSSTEAERIKAYRSAIAGEKKALSTIENTNVVQMYDKNNLEIKLEIEKEIDIDNICNDQQADQPSPKPLKPKKKKYGTYKHVLLSDDELQKLRDEYGEEMTKRCIVFLDEYTERKGYKCKSHYLTIKDWVLDAVKERERKKRTTQRILPTYTQQEQKADDPEEKKELMEKLRKEFGN